MTAFREGCEAGQSRQQTLASSVTFTGVGLHTGARVRCDVRPAPPDFGIVFYSRGIRIPVRIDSVVDSTRCSALGSEGAVIATVEHLLAALAGLRIDNAHVEVDGPELPALDGSALPYAEGLLQAGIAEQDRPARLIRLGSPLWISEGDRHVVAVPADGLTVAAAVDYRRPLAGPQVYSFSLDTAPKSAAAIFALAGATLGSEWDFTVPEPAEGIRGAAAGWGSPLPFLEELAPARTFCFEDWIAAIRAAGLGGGGSIENTLVLSDNGTSTPLRFSNELARHKALDLLGDMALLGGRLCATVVAVKSGHALHLAAAQRIRRSSDER
jgi:UDP-3-O-[3-hydroxymyristoyl] N-acetylglucosamine deacetylase